MRRFREGSSVLLPLHSALPAADQRRVFQRVAPGVRKVVVATNIAETSLTIPDVVFVVDAGRQKCRQYDARRSMSSLEARTLQCTHPSLNMHASVCLLTACGPNSCRRSGCHKQTRGSGKGAQDAFARATTTRSSRGSVQHRYGAGPARMLTCHEMQRV